MNTEIYNQLQLREIFHLEFLRWFGRKVKAEFYAVKGGANLRFSFNSVRYSEDMDIDLKGVRVNVIKDTVMNMLENTNFRNNLKPYGIETITPPDMSKAKQTETTQRFKVHLITFSGEDLFTKVEFSRRGFNGDIVVEEVAGNVLRAYKMSPLVMPHYDIRSAIAQKIGALAARSVIQARDIFDLHIMSSQYQPVVNEGVVVNRSKIARAHENLLEVSFEQFRDTVVSYLAFEEQALYASAARWDEIKLKVDSFLEEVRALK
ncbi:MAG: nucleotidyl transferase AbiEii/AbiGii toxin family protein [Candidatus Omnitrophica bacterium]|nr:nucleotidyl transferase AbiEii/AbiGii toxin family protein [Candidatus Omnitrophota bacterium]